MRKGVWIVEVWNDVLKQWEPTVGVGLSQVEGRHERARWQHGDPSGRFRVVRYLATR